MNAKTSESIKRAFQIYAEAELRAFDALSGEGFEPSSRYEARLTLVRRGYEGRCRAIKLRKAVALVACAVLVIMSVTACVYREEIKSFLVEIFETDVRFENSEGGVKTVETVYSPTYIPAGYELERAVHNDATYHLWYSCGDENVALLEYSQVPRSNYRGHLDNQGSWYSVVEIGEHTVHRVHKNGEYSLLWTTEEYVFFLACHDSIGWEEIEQIILSIEEAE